MKNKLLLCTSLLMVLFSGCAVTQQDVKTKEHILTPVDKSVNSTKSGYEKTTFFFKDIYSSIEDNFSSFKSSMIENPFGHLLLSDEYILENRKELVIWNTKNYDNEKYILKRYLKEKDIKLDYRGLSQADKLSYLNDYYFDLFKTDYENKVKRKYPKPKFDEFISDRENKNRFDEYNLNMLEASNTWLLNMNETKIQVAQKALSTLFGNPRVTNITYNPNSEKLYMTIKSSKNNFERKVYLKVEPDLARKMKNNKSNLKPIILHKLSDKELEFIGINISYNDKNLIAVISDETYIRERIILVSNDKLDLEKENLTYYDIAKDITPPDWYNNLENEENAIIGYGMSLNEKDAKSNAIQDINQTLSVNVKSETKFEKQIDGDQISKVGKSTVELKTKRIELKGIVSLKSQKKDNLWFVAMKYTKN